MTPSKYELFGRFVGRCESPIERYFLTAMLFLNDSTFEPFEHPPIIARDRTGVELGQQYPVEGYRLDFSLTLPGASRRLAIELDGYVHHGATPEQFARDAARQRAIAGAGWTVIRFAGREVTRDPRKCAMEAMREIAREVDAVAAKPIPLIVKADIAASSDPEIAQAQKELANAEAMGDWHETMRLAALVDCLVRKRQGLPPSVGGAL